MWVALGARWEIASFPIFLQQELLLDLSSFCSIRSLSVCLRTTGYNHSRKHQSAFENVLKEVPLKGIYFKCGVPLEFPGLGSEIHKKTHAAPHHWLQHNSFESHNWAITNLQRTTWILKIAELQFISKLFVICLVLSQNVKLFSCCKC